MHRPALGVGQDHRQRIEDRGQQWQECIDIEVAGLWAKYLEHPDKAQKNCEPPDESNAVAEEPQRKA